MTDRLTLADRAHWLALDLYLRRLRYSSRPILLGPYRSEVGFEVLYWIPFLVWALKEYQIDPARCVVVTRGGAASWYPAGVKAFELYQLAEPEACRVAQKVEHAETGLLKQTRITRFDRDLYKLVAQRIGTNPHWLHPSWMYRGFAPWWQDRAGVNFVAARTRYETLPTVPLPTSWQLPEKFLAVRFYARPTFPMTAMSMDFVRQWLEALATRIPLVVLNPRVHVDDHMDFRMAGDNIALMPACPEADNLALTAALLKRSQGFLGTYGGFAQLALRLGVPSLSIYDTWNYTAVGHKALSDWLALKTKIGFTVLDMKNTPYWRSLLP